MPPRRTPRIINFVHGGTTYQLPIDGEIQIRAVNDSPPYVPTSGEQSARSRAYHNAASIKNITNAFAKERELDFAGTGGVIRELFSAEAETRFNSGIWHPPFENNPSMATAQGISVIMPPTDASITQPAAKTGANRNPKGATYYVGTSNSGVFTGRTDEAGANNYYLDVLRWGGSSWAEAAELVAGSTDEVLFHISDFEVHKGALCVLFDDGAGAQVSSNTNGGATWNAFSHDPSTQFEQGSRLIDDGGTLYALINNPPAIADTFEIESTADSGGSEWVSRVSGATGPVRDWARFFDRDGNSQIMILTETRLLWFDTTNYVVNVLLNLPYGGRAIEQWGDELIIFMDNNQVFAYKANGATRDITPSSAFPFGVDEDGQVCVTLGTRGLYALWSGADPDGTDRAPLCLMWDGTGWHFIWQKADTSISGAARFVIIDPQSGDLLIAVQDAVSEDTTLVRLKDTETDPADQGTLDRALAGAITTPRLDFGVPMVPTTVWDVFTHSNGLDANETMEAQYRTDGDTGSYTSIATVAADNTLSTLGSGVGVNARDFQFKFIGSINAKTDEAKIFALDIGYAKLWPVRLMYSFNVRTDFNIPGGRSAQQIRLDITTIMGVQTKGTLNLGGDAASDSATVIPIPETTASEIIGNLSDPGGTKRASTWTLHMLEA